MSSLTRLASGYRANKKAGLGMVLTGAAAGGVSGSSKNPIATTAISYATPHIPKMPDWDADWAARALYLMNGMTMRCVRLRADTVAGLPFQAGPDPLMPGAHDPESPLAKLLGPATVLSPGGPNPTTSSRAFWAWSIVQKIVSGRWAWETLRDPQTKQIYQLWPLVSCCLFPVPSSQDARKANVGPGSPGTSWFESFTYNTPLGRIDLKADRVFYGWRPSILDWREPESDLQAARVPIQLVNGIDRYMWGLMTNQMMARKMVITPPFDESENRRAFEESFLSEFSGFDAAGKTIFAEAEYGIDDTGKAVPAGTQVIDLATTPIDAQLLEIAEAAKADINISLGVPRSLLGDASARTFSNAESEYRNFWTITATNDISEMQDMVNVNLASQVGNDVGWFDLSQVAAVQPEQIFQPPAIKDAIDMGLVTAEQAAVLLNIPRLTSTGVDVETAPIGEELNAGYSQQSRSIRLGRRALPLDQHDGWFDAPEGWRFVHRSANTYTLRAGLVGWGLDRLPVERFRVRSIASEPPQIATEVHTSVARVRHRREMGIRSKTGKLVASGVAVKAADTGRVLMLQRSDKDSTDPAGGTWEFPGGHIEPGEDSYDAALREWCEETGCKAPQGDVAGSWTSPNGIYRGHVLVVPSEASVPVNLDPTRRKVLNPDDPDGDDIETAAWWDPRHVTADNPAIRKELRKSADTWVPVVKAARLARREIGKRSTDEVSASPVIDIAAALVPVTLTPAELAELDTLADALTTAGL